MYAFMVVTCISFCTQQGLKPLCTVTEMYINILRHCIQKHCDKPLRHLDKCVTVNRENIMSLAEIAFTGTQQKMVTFTEMSCEESNVQFAFLRAIMVPVAPTAMDIFYTFLHYTVQEFFAALWLLQNPDNINEVLQECLTEERKHMKHIVPFLCGLLNANNTKIVKCLVPAQQIMKTANWFIKTLVDTFVPLQTNQDNENLEESWPERDLQFLCQCLYESQSTEACLLLLDKLDYQLDLSGEHLDPHYCCTVAYVINQCKERKVRLDLEECTVSDQGHMLLLGCLQNVESLG